ncbi:hypothetical protein GJ496_003977 [Pomphorhynchus laevis]|nr:hypothetical protein GJ496_003977 [Pomphorhynchus laevis]
MTSKFAGVTVSQLTGENEIQILVTGANVHFVLTGSECNIICFQNKLTYLTINISSRTAEFTRLHDRCLLISHSSNCLTYTGYNFIFENNGERDKVYLLLKQMMSASTSKHEVQSKSTDVADGVTTSNIVDNGKNTNKTSDCVVVSNKSHGELSLFDRRTDDASASQYFQFYGYLSQQQNMMQDFIRTSTYQRAILDNHADFSDKIVLDVGAGSGILSFFAVQAGARKVYAIEASAIAAHAEALVEANGFHNRIKVLTGKLEDLELPEKVDVIISEPMGYMLFNERMLETYLHAKKWMKPDGKMFPSTGILFITPFTDEGLYMEQMSKCNFWAQTSFYGVDLSTLRDEAIREYFRQPVVDNFDVRVCLCKPVRHTVNFLTADETDLHEMKIPLEFKPMTTAIIHGLAFWFDVLFDGSNTPVWLSTAPTQPLTHWYQVRCLMPNPLIITHGQTLEGFVHFKSNTRQSYEIDIELRISRTDMVSRNSLDLKNPFFRYTGQVVPPPPPGTQRECPTESFFSNSYSGQPYSVGGNDNMDSQCNNSIPCPIPMAISSGGTSGSDDASSMSNYYHNSMSSDGHIIPISQQQQHYYPSNTIHHQFYEHSEQAMPGAIYFGDGSSSAHSATATKSVADQSSYLPNNCNINNDTSGLFFTPIDDNYICSGPPNSYMYDNHINSDVVNSATSSTASINYNTNISNGGNNTFATSLLKSSHPQRHISHSQHSHYVGDQHNAERTVKDE